MVDATKLADFEGKQVILTLAADDGTASELEGKVEAASAQGIAFKEKGKRDVDLVLPEKIVEIALAPSKPKSLIQKKLKPVTESTVRQHLVDRHGASRSAMNKMSDADAFKFHADVDHADLGHKHVEATETEANDEAGSEE